MGNKEKARRGRRIEERCQAISTIIMGIPPMLPGELCVSEQSSTVAALLEEESQPREHAVLLCEVGHVQHDDVGESVPSIYRENASLGKVAGIALDALQRAAGRFRYLCKARNLDLPRGLLCAYRHG